MINMQIDKFKSQAEEASQLLAAMANQRRLMILCSLLEREMNVTELGERVELGQSPLSQHLSKLRAWGLVKPRRDGQQIYYSLASGKVQRVLETLYELYCA